MCQCTHLYELTHTLLYQHLQKARHQIRQDWEKNQNIFDFFHSSSIIRFITIKKKEEEEEGSVHLSRAIASQLTSRAGGEGALGGGHGAAVVGDLAEPGHAPEVDLGAVLEGDDDVAPLADEPWHHHHGRHRRVGEVGAVGAGEPGDDAHAAGGEAVPEDEGAGHRRQRQR